MKKATAATEGHLGTKKTTATVALAILVMMLASNAFASIALTPSVKQVNVSRNDIIGIQFRLKNLGYDKACIDLEADYDNSYLDVGISDEDICLNDAESTNVTLTIKTQNAPRGLHAIALEAFSSEGDAEATLSIYVSEEPEIELVAYGSDICIGGQEYVNVLVRNNSDEYKEVKLQAENEMLLPYFERRELTLAPYQEKYAELRLHPSAYSAEGSHYVSMYAITDDETVKERVEVEVVDCGEEDMAEFNARVASGCFTVEKGERERIYFTVENRLNEEQKVYFSVGGSLETRLRETSAWLEGEEEREFYFEVLANEDDIVKDYELKLHVWNNDHSVEKRICVRPEKAHSVGVELKENDLLINDHRSAVFTVLLVNGGDYSEEFEIDYDNHYSGLVVVLSQDRVTVERHETREIYVNVSVPDDIEAGNYSVALNIEANGEDFEKELRFEVLESEPAETGGLKIMSSPSSITLGNGEEKKALLTLKNTGQADLAGIAIDILGLPEGVSSSPETNASLLPGEEKAFELTVKANGAAPGEYTIVLQAYNLDASDSRAISLVVEEGEEEPADGFMTGLVGLFSAGGAALLGLAILVLVVIAILLLARGGNSNPSTTRKNREVWLRG